VFRFQQVRVPRAGLFARATLLALAVGCLAASPAGATIVFQCSDNLCRINADGSGRTQITSDGSSTNDYHWPSLSRGGTRMAWIRHGGLYLGDANASSAVGPMTNAAGYLVIRPDGGQVAALVHSSVYDEWYVYVYNADGSIAVSGVHPDDPAIGWSPGNGLLLPWSLDSPGLSATVGICAVSSDTTSCVTRLAYNPLLNFSDPAVSPDGKLLAVSVKNRSSDAGGYIALYDYTTHERLRMLTNGTQDTNIAWSPDGSRLVFQRGTSLYTTGVNDVPGAEKLLTAGETPSWGGTEPVAVVTPVPTPTPAQPAPAVFKATSAFGLPGNGRCLRRGAKLTLRFLKPSGVTITRVDVRAGGRLIARRTGANARRSITLRKLPHRRFKLTVRVTPRGGAPVSMSRTYRVCA